MKVLSLFSGIGAFEKALKNLGIPCDLVAYCDFDKYASKSYSAIHDVPESMNLGDITKVDEKQLPKDINLITYGFPCQDISLAGKQKGLFNADGSQTRSGLFFEALRIIEETQPRVAIAENVKNLTSKKFALQFKIVLDSLRAAGYNNYFQVLNAKDYGIPQNRERVFIVSIRRDIDGSQFKFPEGFPLELRLKDVLEDAVDEKYYLSKKMIEYVTANVEGCGFGGDINPQIARSLTATMNKMHRAGVDNYVSDSIEMVGMLDMKGNEQVRRVYGTNGIAPTLNTMQGGHRQPKVLVREATKKGYAEACEGDSINLEQPNSKTRRGRVGKQVAQTLTTSPQQGVLLYEGVTAAAMRGRYGEVGCVQQHIEVSDREYANALTTVQKDSMVAETFYAQGCGLRIRKLTPKECFRLMGFEDSDFEKAEAVNSNSQLYKQAGNSIVVPVVQGIIQGLLDCGVLEERVN